MEQTIRYGGVCIPAFSIRGLSADREIRIASCRRESTEGVIQERLGFQLAMENEAIVFYSYGNQR